MATAATIKAAAATATTAPTINMVLSPVAAKAALSEAGLSTLASMRYWFPRTRRTLDSASLHLAFGHSPYESCQPIICLCASTTQLLCCHLSHASLLT